MHTTYYISKNFVKLAIFSGIVLFAFACTKQQTSNPSNGNGGGVKDILPIAGFQYEISSTTPIVNFKDTSKNAIAWLWKFGDDSISTEQNPTHTYKKENPANEVKLIVTSSTGKKDSTKNISVPIIFFSPIPSFSWSIPNAHDPSTIEFKSNSLNTSAATWNFNDGTTTTGNIVSHTFPATNNYNVILTAGNAYGKTNSTNQNIYVNVISKIVINSISLTHVPDNYVGGVSVENNLNVALTAGTGYGTPNLSCTNNSGIITSCTWNNFVPATVVQLNENNSTLNLTFTDKQADGDRPIIGNFLINYTELKSHYPSTKIYLSESTPNQGGYLAVTLDVQYQL